tara:strand:- start:124 stop:813 length:690 start_codon:yes stop_codon:yes gene_type:complete
VLLNIFLYSLLVLFAFFSRINLSGFQEYSFLEFFQVFILIIGLIINLNYRKLILKFTRKSEYFLKVFIFFFIIYEELSFLTYNKFPFLDQFNHQSEINLHNLHIFRVQILENIYIPLLNYEFTLILPVLFMVIAFFVFGYGSRLPFFSKYPFLFLEHKFSHLSFVYFINIVITSLMVNKFNILNINDGGALFHSEYIELFIYIIILFDSIFKINKMKKRRSRYFNKVFN